MDGADTIGVVETLVQRHAFVAALREQPRAKRELVASLDISRPTVYRGLRDLEEVGLVEHDDGEYALTTYGDLVADRFAALLDSVESAAEIQSFLRWVPPGTLDLDPRHLADADVFSGSPGDPYAMVNRHVRRLSQTEHVRAVLPLTGLHAHEAMHDRIVEDDSGRAELVVAPAVADTFRTDPDYRPLTADLAATDRYDVRVAADDVPYFLGVLDDVTQLGVDDDGQPRALLETADPTVRDWAIDAFERRWAAAEPVDLGDDDGDDDRDDRDDRDDDDDDGDDGDD